MVFGETAKGSGKRVPVVSFGVKGRSSRELVESVDQGSGFGIRWGHFYSKRLVDEVVGVGDEGVVRVSMVHYNTGTFSYCLLNVTLLTDVWIVEEEIRGLVEVLDRVLS